MAKGRGGRGRGRGFIARQGIRWANNRGTNKGKKAPIGWGSPGDFRRCLRVMHHVPARMRKGYCANRHKEATGRWPGRGRGH